MANAHRRDASGVGREIRGELVEDIGNRDRLFLATKTPIRGDVSDTEADVIRTAFSLVTSGMAGQPNPDTIDQLIALRDGTSSANIPNGRILRGPGAGNHNAPWSWHIDPDSLEFADMTMEVCDGLPSHVEDGTLAGDRYCPWSAEVIDIEPAD